MTTESVDPSTLREQLDAVGIDLNAGDATGYVALEPDLNLNAIAIGLGLENIAYEPEQFPSLIYHLDQPATTVLLFENGVIATVDGADEEAVRDAIVTAIERIADLGLVEIDLTPSVNVNESIPIAEVIEAKD